MAKRMTRDTKQGSNNSSADKIGVLNERIASINMPPVGDNLLVVVGSGVGRTKSMVKANLLHAQCQSRILLVPLIKLFPSNKES